MRGTNRYTVTDDSELIAEEADLEGHRHTWPDGTPLTETSTNAYTTQRAAGGAPPHRSHKRELD